MCTNPIRIRNKKYKSLGTLIDTYISVPCGKCDECLKKRANDIYVRARSEYDKCVRNGGCGFMCCLTYSEDVVPKLDIKSLDGKNRVFVFNKQDVINFFKRLRINFSRLYIAKLHKAAPLFKYLVTAEFGTDPTRSHRPHYHILIFFDSSVSTSLFRKAFTQSLYNKRTHEKYFGLRHQCELIDPKKGGIHYTSKYVCKDLMYEYQREYINKMIKFYKDYVNTKFNVINFPSSPEEEFRNRCIRSTKEYKQAVREFVLPYRHMLQFYMLSNDLGVSSYVDRYGEHLLSCPVVNIENFVYSIPKIIKERFQDTYGIEKRCELDKRIFIRFLQKAGKDLVNSKEILPEQLQDALVFAHNYVLLIGGKFKLVNPMGIDFVQSRKDGIYFRDWDSVLNDFIFYDDNSFFDLRSLLYRIIQLYNSEERMMFRASVARRKMEKQRNLYEQKKKNKPSNY